jgi:ubiquinone/menaquinone biosynthesis C-methylase UbiE
MANMQGGVALVWSAVRRLPLPDRSIDLIHTRMAVPMSLDPLVNEGMLYEWHRLLRPGGYVVITSDVSRYLTGTLTSSAGAVRAGAHPF